MGQHGLNHIGRGSKLLHPGRGAAAQIVKPEVRNGHGLLALFVRDLRYSCLEPVRRLYRI
ncbi:hypothetical protein CU102_25430 [Phyllobacterium brassicacearum]|uniref:Uncharacterized protein n=1 Tax=Phyllobacterium brassicacearum TaxID=314235 RepID=A0A2P7B816_9HYPH|nr:hypothetical protein CU102_25430 [Phyllobacterium brassicacearum]